MKQSMRFVNITLLALVIALTGYIFCIPRVALATYSGPCPQVETSPQHYSCPAGTTKFYRTGSSSWSECGNDYTADGQTFVGCCQYSAEYVDCLDNTTGMTTSSYVELNLVTTLAGVSCNHANGRCIATEPP